MKRLLVAWLLVLGCGPAARAAEVLYARSNGDLEGRRHPQRYSALNILDGDAKTVWCSSGSGKGAEVEVVFSERVRIDRLEVATGNQSSAGAFKKFTRVAAMEAVAGDTSNPLELADRQGRQTLHFDPPLATRRLVFKLSSGHRGSSRRHACLSDLIFFQGRRALNGKQLKPHIKRSLSRLDFIDTWVSGPEYARNRELVFSIQGRFHYRFVPHDPMQQAVSSSGKFRISQGRPELQLGKAWVPVLVKRDDAGRVVRLKLPEEEALLAGMPGVYTRRRDVYTW